MTLRERIARAIYATDPVGVRPWEDAPTSNREDCFACAAAALAAVEAAGFAIVPLEPTEMGGGRDLAASRRLASLTEKFHDKQYRDSYVASNNRGVLAQQMRNFREDLSQADYAEKTGKQKTVIGRLESPAYAGWSLRTMLDIARKEDVAVIVRFVDFPTFLKYSGDLSDEALRPAPYDKAATEIERRDRIEPNKPEQEPGR